MVPRASVVMAGGEPSWPVRGTSGGDRRGRSSAFPNEEQVAAGLQNASGVYTTTTATSWLSVPMVSTTPAGSGTASFTCYMAEQERRTKSHQNLVKAAAEGLAISQHGCGRVVTLDSTSVSGGGQQNIAEITSTQLSLQDRPAAANPLQQNHTQRDFREQRMTSESCCLAGGPETGGRELVASRGGIPCEQQQQQGHQQSRNGASVCHKNGGSGTASKRCLKGQTPGHGSSSSDGSRSTAATGSPASLERGEGTVEGYTATTTTSSYAGGEGVRVRAPRGVEQGRVTPTTTTTTRVAPQDRLDVCVALVLRKLTRASKEPSAINADGIVTVFHSSVEPSISIEGYVARLCRFFKCSSACALLALIYIDRLIRCHPGFGLSALNAHRLFVTALTIAVKFFDDTYYSNSYYSRVGGLALQELNRLERIFLVLLDFRLHVHVEEFLTAVTFVRLVALEVLGAGANLQERAVVCPTPPPSVPVSTASVEEMDRSHRGERYNTAVEQAARVHQMHDDRMNVVSRHIAVHGEGRGEQQGCEGRMNDITEGSVQQVSTKKTPRSSDSVVVLVVDQKTGRETESSDGVEAASMQRKERRTTGSSPPKVVEEEEIRMESSRSFSGMSQRAREEPPNGYAAAVQRSDEGRQTFFMEVEDSVEDDAAAVEGMGSLSSSHYPPALEVTHQQCVYEMGVERREDESRAGQQAMPLLIARYRGDTMNVYGRSMDAAGLEERSLEEQLYRQKRSEQVDSAVIDDRLSRGGTEHNSAAAALVREDDTIRETAVKCSDNSSVTPLGAPITCQSTCGQHREEEEVVEGEPEKPQCGSNEANQYTMNVTSLVKKTFQRITYPLNNSMGPHSDDVASSSVYKQQQDNPFYRHHSSKEDLDRTNSLGSLVSCTSSSQKQEEERHHHHERCHYGVYCGVQKETCRPPQCMRPSSASLYYYYYSTSCCCVTSTSVHQGRHYCDRRQVRRVYTEEVGGSEGKSSASQKQHIVACLQCTTCMPDRPQVQAKESALLRSEERGELIAIAENGSGDNCCEMIEKNEGLVTQQFRRSYEHAKEDDADFLANRYTRATVPAPSTDVGTQREEKMGATWTAAEDFSGGHCRERGGEGRTRSKRDIMSLSSSSSFCEPAKVALACSDICEVSSSSFDDGRSPLSKALQRFGSGRSFTSSTTVATEADEMSSPNLRRLGRADSNGTMDSRLSKECEEDTHGAAPAEQEEPSRQRDDDEESLPDDSCSGVPLEGAVLGIHQQKKAQIPLSSGVYSLRSYCSRDEVVYGYEKSTPGMAAIASDIPAASSSIRRMTPHDHHRNSSMEQPISSTVSGSGRSAARRAHDCSKGGGSTSSIGSTSSSSSCSEGRLGGGRLTGARGFLSSGKNKKLERKNRGAGEGTRKKGLLQHFQLGLF